MIKHQEYETFLSILKSIDIYYNMSDDYTVYAKNQALVNKVQGFVQRYKPLEGVVEAWYEYRLCRNHDVKDALLEKSHTVIDEVRQKLFV